MTREERELRAKVAQMKASARALVGEDKLKEARDLAAQAEQMAEKADLLARLEVEEAEEAGQRNPEAKERKEAELSYRDVFMKAFRRRAVTLDALSQEERRTARAALERMEVKGLHESPDENGGLIVPQDIQTAIHEYKRTLNELEPYIDVTRVGTNKGSRVYEKLSTMTPLQNLTDDAADLPEETPPTFEKLEYNIKDYGGWLPIPNDLLEDSDQNIIAFLTKWMAKKSVVTRNSLILAAFKKLAAVPLADYKKIKQALNVTLDPMFAANAILLTNQDGFQYLDTLETNDGKPLLQPDVTDPTRKLFAGKRVVVIGNNVLPTEKTGASGSEKFTAPLFIGSPQDYLTMFERKGYEIASTNIGGTSFRKNRTEMRMIEREDFVEVDSAALVYGKIDVTGAR